MKKMFLAALTALALCSYSYAQDDDEYEEEDAPARVVKKAPAVDEEEEEDEAPAPKVEKKKAKKSSDGEGGFFGIGLDLTGVLANQTKINATFKLADNMALTAIFGFWHSGETTIEANNQEQDQGDDYTSLAIGAGFDFYPIQGAIPFSIGAEFVYNSLAPNQAWQNNSRIDIDILAGVHGELVKNLVLSGKAGLAIDYDFGDDDGNPKVEYSHMGLGLAYKVYLTWFAF